MSGRFCSGCGTESFRCPECNAPARSASAYCPACGFQRSTPEPPESAPLESPPPRAAPLQDASAPSPRSARRRPRRWLLVSWAVVAALLTATVAVGVIARGHGGGDHTSATTLDQPTPTDHTTSAAPSSPPAAPATTAVTPASSATTTTSSPATSSTITGTSAAPTVATSSQQAAVLGGHLTSDGSEPTPMVCEGLAGVCLAAPLEVLTADLGPPTQRSAGLSAGETIHEWDLGSTRLYVTTDSVDAVTAVTLAWPPESKARASVGGGGPVVGAHLGLADVAALYGAVGSSEFFCGENTFLVDFTSQQGPEGGITVSYETSGEGCPTDPTTNEGRLASFGHLPLTSTTVN